MCICKLSFDIGMINLSIMVSDLNIAVVLRFYIT